MSTQSDKLVLDLFENVKARKREIEKISKIKWETSCTVGYNPDSADRINIQIVTDATKLLDLYSFLKNKRNDWNVNSKELGISTPNKYMGYEIAQYLIDIKNRFEQLSICTKKKDLEALEKRLDALISVDQRRELELAAIQKELENS